jgi:hypothetical protein
MYGVREEHLRWTQVRQCRDRMGIGSVSVRVVQFVVFDGLLIWDLICAALENSVQR